MGASARRESGTNARFARLLPIVKTRLARVLDGAESDEDRPEKRSSARARRAWTPLNRALTATGDRWTLTIALALAPGGMRLTQLQKRLSGVSAGVLERHLHQMVALGLMTRTRFKEMPPRVELELTDAGRELLPVAAALARWGIRYLWSPPREGERVDLDALLRLLPVLLAEETGLPEGSLEALVTDADPPVRKLYRVQDARLRVDERESERTSDRASARVEGDADAWIAALGPAGDRARLRFDGDERLAGLLLDALHGQPACGLPQWAS
jgi:DNA-binding HxlR family transcriptional regulator